MKVLFWLNKHRANSRGEAPLMLRVTHHGKRWNVTTDVRIDPKLSQDIGNAPANSFTDTPSICG